MDPNEYPWWKTTTVYQIYPRSFQDTTGNGIGDIPGIISRLDYLKDLGIETLWISPFFESPQQDFGYDISDYLAISPEYGTMDDCDQLIEEVHQRGMKVIFDLVLNHTSDQHPWFIESRSSRDNPKRDWYIWRDGKKPNGKKPPNNWESMVSGSGWHYDELTDQWYWAQFLPFQPDLNYRNPEVKAQMFEIMRYWLDKGVDGFRLDIIGSIYEDEQFRDNPKTWQFLPFNDERGLFFRSAIMTINVEDNYTFVQELRQVLDGYSPARFLVGEAFGRLPLMVKYCGGKQNNGLHTVFLFHSMETKFNAKSFRKLIAEIEKYFEAPLTPTWVFSNHDSFRYIHRLKYNRNKAKLLAGLQLTLRGVPYIYYGQEIGMEHVDIPIKSSKDSLAALFSHYPLLLTNLIMKISNGGINRDGCRTPMQWDATKSAGFTRSKFTWLPLGRNSEEINVETQMTKKASLLKCYKMLLKIRSNYACLREGKIRLLDVQNKHVLAYQRIEKSQDLICLANFSRKNQFVDLPSIKTISPIFSTVKCTDKIEFTKDQYSLKPFEFCIFEVK